MPTETRNLTGFTQTSDPVQGARIDRLQGKERDGEDQGREAEEGEQALALDQLGEQGSGPGGRGQGEGGSSCRLRGGSAAAGEPQQQVEEQPGRSEHQGEAEAGEDEEAVDPALASNRARSSVPTNRSKAR